MQAGLFTVHNSQPFLGYRETLDRNGTCPIFTRDTANLILSWWQNAYSGTGQDAWYDEKYDSYNFEIDGHVQQYGAVECYAEGQRTFGYAIGSGVLPWSEISLEMAELAYSLVDFRNAYVRLANAWANVPATLAEELAVNYPFADSFAELQVLKWAESSLTTLKKLLPDTH